MHRKEILMLSDRLGVALAGRPLSRASARCQCGETEVALVRESRTIWPVRLEWEPGDGPASLAEDRKRAVGAATGTQHEAESDVLARAVAKADDQYVVKETYLACTGCWCRKSEGVETKVIEAVDMSQAVAKKAGLEAGEEG